VLTAARAPDLRQENIMALVLKSRVGMPRIQYHGEKIDLAAQARRARRRLYPVTVLYSAYALSILALALRRAGSPLLPLAYWVAGAFAWTFLEYFAHRWVLHQRFPDGTGAWQRWAHRTFDNLHTEHHARPWDGSHINGTIKDTWLYVVLFGALSLLAPLPTLPVLWASVVQCYVIEEWVHHSVHYLGLYKLGGPYWRYINRHHAWHHSPHGDQTAFGLTNGFWDVVFGTRVPAPARAKLYRRR
jgi:sterol desaturase/sphingolipid hydroxylase (fatty acid hydroxylase superfamily)